MRIIHTIRTRSGISKHLISTGNHPNLYNPNTKSHNPLSFLCIPERVILFLPFPLLNIVILKPNLENPQFNKLETLKKIFSSPPPSGTSRKQSQYIIFFFIDFKILLLLLPPFFYFLLLFFFFLFVFLLLVIVVIKNIIV